MVKHYEITCWKCGAFVGWSVTWWRHKKLCIKCQTKAKEKNMNYQTLLVNFKAKVEAMRKAQSRYFQSRDYGDLKSSKTLEKEVDTFFNGINVQTGEIEGQGDLWDQ